jgi:hypothetical protein
MNHRYATWDEAREAIQKLLIRSAHEYMRRYREDSRLPPNPYDEYTDHESINSFFRVRRNTSFYATWQEASAAAIALGVRGQIMYRKNYRKDPLLPAQPRRYPGFPGWGIFLKTGNLHNRGRMVPVYEKMEDAAKVVQTLAIKNKLEYYDRYKEDARLPRHPERKYKNGWPGWSVFLGKKQHNDT